MMTWPKPSTVKGTRRIGYYRKFIHHYGIIDQALTHMLKNDSFRWTAAVENAFEELKRAMASGPVLALPDFSQQFIAECDASGLGLGAVLMQEADQLLFLAKLCIARIWPYLRMRRNVDLRQFKNGVHISLFVKTKNGW
ncbi:hypothetical protein Peur_011434 [Populus x canadensis]